MTPEIYNLLGRSVNVNTELHDYKPLSFDEVMDLAVAKSDNFDLIRKPTNVVLP
jgi:calcineurin-like phosphoesterase family protein